jgi:hypothetical protein
MLFGGIIMKNSKSLGLTPYFLTMIIGLTIIIFTTTVQKVIACSPTVAIPGYIPPTPIPLETRVADVSNKSQIIIDGTVKTWVAASDMNSIVTVEVAEYLKGHGPKTIKIVGYFWICAPNFGLFERSRYIFFTNGNPYSESPLLVQNWLASQEAVIASVKSSTGNDPVSPDLPFDVLWLIPFAIIILGIFIFAQKLRNHK